MSLIPQLWFLQEGDLATLCFLVALPYYLIWKTHWFLPFSSLGFVLTFFFWIILSGAWGIFPAQCSGVTSGGAKQTMQYQELNPLLLLVKSPENSLPALPSLGCLYFFFKFISFMFEIFYSFCLFVLFAPYLVALKHYSWILLRNDSDRLWGPYGMPGQNLSKANNLSAVVLLQT